MKEFNEISVSVIIPAFNEEENIKNTIMETVKSINSSGISDFEIIVVNDGSYDNTSGIVNDLIESGNAFLKIIDYKPNRGKGYALRTGAARAVKKLIVFLDADLELHPIQITNLLKKMKDTGSDVVIGSKRNKNSIINYSFKRKIFSSMYYYIVKILFGLPVKDTQTGLKLFRGEVLKNVIGNLVIEKYAFDIELLISLHKNGFSIGECPIEVTQVRQKGRIGIRDIFLMLKDTLRIFYRLYFKKAYK